MDKNSVRYSTFARFVLISVCVAIFFTFTAGLTSFGKSVETGLTGNTTGSNETSENLPPENITYQPPTKNSYLKTQRAFSKVFTVFWDVGAYAGVVLIVYGIYRFLLSTLEDTSEPKVKAVITILIGVVLISFKVLMQKIMNGTGVLF